MKDTRVERNFDTKGATTVMTRRIRTDADQADKTALPFCLEKNCTSSMSGLGSRKPSERFMRRPLYAKTKASRSERIRIADLKEKLVQDLGNKATDNAHSSFNGYRPGSAGHTSPPG